MSTWSSDVNNGVASSGGAQTPLYRSSERHDVRYIGNKTKLLEFIGSALDEKRIASGRAMDAFAGTATVARFLKERGFEVVSADIMTYSYVFQKAYVEL